MPLSLHVSEQECATTGRETHINAKMTYIEHGKINTAANT
jgi:hypothetical protein